MRISELPVRSITFAVAFILAVIGIAISSTGAARITAPPAGDQAASLAAWNEIATVLQNPRCLNCHQLNSPLQGDSRRELSQQYGKQSHVGHSGRTALATRAGVHAVAGSLERRSMPRSEGSKAQRQSRWR